MTWSSSPTAPTPPQVGWWNTPDAPAAFLPAWGSSPLYIMATGIPSAEAFGTPMVSLTIAPTGIPSAEAFGTPTIAVLPKPKPVVVSTAVRRAATI